MLPAVKYNHPAPVLTGGIEMTSRQRLIKTLNHEQPDHIPIDLGSTSVTGISASTLYRLRNFLGLPEHPVIIGEMFQMLGLVEEDVREMLKVDVVGLPGPANFFGVRENKSYRPFTMFDGTPTRIADNNVLSTGENGRIYLYPQGDQSVPPCAQMPVGGYFFDNIDRAGEFDEDDLDPDRDFQDAFSLMSEEDAAYFERESKRLDEETSYGIVGSFGGGGLGDVAILPGPAEKHPRGIRRMEDWLVAHILYPEYIERVYEMQTEIALKNLEIYRQAVGERIQVIFLSGTDFGTQNGPFISLELFRKLYKPFYRKMNDWIHANTNWKIFYHSCGSIAAYLDDFAEIGVDILNPVQLSAAGMDPLMLKEKYGDTFTFWGGGADTQQMLPFGTPEQISADVAHRLDILAQGGGYVFNTIHNIVANVPTENLMAMYRAVWAHTGRANDGK